MMVHCRYGRGSRGFWRYVKHVEAGFTYPALFGQAFPAIQACLNAPPLDPPHGSRHGLPAQRDTLRRIAAGEFAPHREPDLTLFG